MHWCLGQPGLHWGAHNTLKTLSWILQRAGKEGMGEGKEKKEDMIIGGNQSHKFFLSLACLHSAPPHFRQTSLATSQ